VREVIPGSRKPRGQTKHTLKKVMMLAAMLTMVVIVVVVPTLAFDRDRFEGRFGEDLFAAGFIWRRLLRRWRSMSRSGALPGGSERHLDGLSVSDEGDYGAHLPSTSVTQATSTTHPASYSTAA
jgi:hypothetical protein